MYESSYESFQKGNNDKVGSFTVDKYSGKNTSFKVYFKDLVESYIKSISIRSQKGSTFNTIMDSRMSLHYLSIYDAPFDQVRHLFYLCFIIQIDDFRIKTWVILGSTA